MWVQRLREDTDIVVSGTVRSVPIIELERELGAAILTLSSGIVAWVETTPCARLAGIAQARTESPFCSRSQTAGR